MQELFGFVATIVTVVLAALSAASFKWVAETTGEGSIGRMSGRIGACLLVLMRVINCPLAAASAHERPFTVIDAIEMTKIVDPAPFYSYASREFRRSPDGEKFVVVLRRGHLATDQVEDQLVLFKTADVLAFVNASPPRKRPLREVLADFRTSSGRSPIDGVRWRDNDTLTFIGRTGGKAAGQVYAFDLRTHALKKLTNAPGGIFAYDTWKRTLVYSAPVFPDWRKRNRQGYVVGPTIISNLTITDPRNALIYDLAFFLEKPGFSRPVRLDTGLNWVAHPYGDSPLPDEISISPDGLWAIVLATARSIPSSWAGYTFIRDILCSDDDLCYPQTTPHSWQLKAALDALVPTTASVPRAFGAKQYFLVDITHATVRPFLDAPGPSDAGFGTDHVTWSPDSKRVVLATTYLPLDISQGQERTRRGAAPAVVEVDVPSGKYARISDRVSSISSVRWLPGGDIRIKWRDKGNAPPQVQCYRKRGHQWVEISPLLAHWAPRRLELRIEEDLNTPPQIVALDRETRMTGVITDLNPQLRALTLGHGEIFEWQDRMGRRYRGGLILPPGFRSGHRYPVVLQTYGFFPKEFLVDGPQDMPTAYAARALANRGIVVLQMPSNALSPPPSDSKGLPWRYDRDSENPRFVAKMEGAIDALSKRGLIDRTRVGLIGFSRAGMHVQYALTFSKYPIAAATIADSVQATPFAYVVDFGLPYPAGMADFENKYQMIGAGFWGDGIQKWIKRSPAFHLDKIRTPLRLEHLGTHVPEFWDMYALLKRHHRPVEMISLPLASHQVARPADQYMSEQGNVDWFAFWLKNEIDPDPAKAAQYERWRELRRQYEAEHDSVNARRVAGHSAG